MIIIGTGGHGKVVISALHDHKIYAFQLYDDHRIGTLWNNEILGTVQDIITEGIGLRSYHVAVGNNAIRQSIMEKLTMYARPLRPASTLIHPKASVASGAKIGQGSFIAAGTVIGPDAVIGDGCIINHGATVDHDCVLGDYVHVCPGAHLAGNVNIGDRTQVGIGANVIQGVTIGEDCMVGAGAAVVGSFPDRNRLLVGIPAKSMIRSVKC